jgi:hypothetical protein
MNNVMFGKKSDKNCYIGRNGVGFCCGLTCYEIGDKVVISPINSKGYSANCTIDIPKDQIKNVIKMLKKNK